MYQVIKTQEISLQEFFSGWEGITVVFVFFHNFVGSFKSLSSISMELNNDSAQKFIHDTLTQSRSI